MADVKTIQTTPAVADFASATGSPLLWDATNKKAYLLADGDIVTQISGSGTGSVTSVSGTGTVNGITLTGTVTTSGSLTLGGTLSGVSLTTQVTGTLPYANGGTGATSFTNHGVVVAGASALSTVAPGSSGNLLTSNGTDWTSAAPATSGTVTSVNVTTANGVSATGGPITTTGSFTFTLGAITPSSVAASGAVSGTSFTDSGLTIGSVPFAGTGGLLSQDNTGLFWDASNKRLGVGANANTPTVTLYSGGDLTVKGNIAVGNFNTTSLPIDVSANTTTPMFHLLNTKNSGYGSTFVYAQMVQGNSDNYDFLGFYNNTNDFKFGVTGSGKFRIGSNNLITIGNSNQFQLSGTTAATNSEGVSAWSNDDTNFAGIELGKSKGTTIGSNVIVGAATKLGGITGYGATGTGFTNAAQIIFRTDGTPGATNDMPGAIDFYTTPDGSGTLTLALTLDNAQKATFAGAIAVTGHTTFEGVTSTGATGTGKLVYDGTPTLVTPNIGAATGTSVNVSGAVTGSNLTVWSTFTPNRTGWTDVGSATVTGRKCKVGNVGYFQVKVVPGVTTATVAGTSYIDLPFTAAGIGGDASMTDLTTFVSVGNCVVDATNSRVYVPAQAATSDSLNISGWFEV